LEWRYGNEELSEMLSVIYSEYENEAQTLTTGAETWENLAAILQDTRQADLLEMRYQRLSETCRK